MAQPPSKTQDPAVRARSTYADPLASRRGQPDPSARKRVDSRRTEKSTTARSALDPLLPSVPSTSKTRDTPHRGLDTRSRSSLRDPSPSNTTATTSRSRRIPKSSTLDAAMSQSTLASSPFFASSYSLGKSSSFQSSRSVISAADAADSFPAVHSAPPPASPLVVSFPTDSRHPSSASTRSHPHPYTQNRGGPPSRKSSGTGSDRDAGSHLDMKRLLSKPALPTRSTSSIISLPSESEAQSTSGRLFRTHLSQEGLNQQRRAAAAGERPVLHVDPSLAARIRPTVAHISREPDQGQKVRHVLRRKPSSQAALATPTAASFKIGESSSTAPVRRRTEGSPPIRQTASLKDAPAAKRNSPLLTPAGAVAEAYKQQEQRREEIAEQLGWNAQGHMARASPAGVAQDVHTPERLETAGGAYFTVFGGESGRLVAMGSPDDESWGDEHMKGKTAGAMRRSLSRKVSGRFRKVAGAVMREIEASPIREAAGTESGQTERVYTRRPSLQTPEHRAVAGSSQSPESPLKDSGEASPASGRSIERWLLEGKTRETRENRLTRAKIGKNEVKDREEEPSPGGSKLWKLVKRISSGGLREKYHSRDSTPPPVPALPKELQGLPATSRTTFDIKGSKERSRENSGEGSVFRSFMQSRASLSGVRPTTAPSLPMSSLPHTISSRPSTGLKHSNGNRPSTTTRSSSPISSDIASARFFAKTHSTGSSTSSYAELPPIPTSPLLGQHIMPPKELNRLNNETSTLDKEKRFRKPVRTQSAPENPDPSSFPSFADDYAVRPSLPHPPRRPLKEGTPRSPSPTIPTFNTTDVFNNFSSPSSLPMPTDEFGVINNTPPPRPRRSSRRQLSNPDVLVLSSSTSTPVTPPYPITPRTPMTVDVGTPNRSSYASTARPRPSSTSTTSSPTSAGSKSRSPLTFRELESPRQIWSEKEKADKWDDLLERSARAGGTLHIGEAGLMSDNIRFSQLSEI